MKTPPPYQFFRIGKTNGTFFVLQSRCITSGRPLEAVDLSLFVVLLPIQTPFWRVTVCKGSKMLLDETAALPLLASGRIKPVVAETLIPYREGADALKRDRAEAKKKDLAGRTGVL